MVWSITFCAEFLEEFEGFDPLVQVRLLGHLRLLQAEGPSLGRPRVDTLGGSRYLNMKELRFTAGSAVWRVAFAFDPARRAVILVGGDKCSVNQRRFYQGLIKRADERFERHLAKGEHDVQDT
ncbi:TPA: type II toxin-antitoxin system RelE/ParE family toxin [Pseudomonas putida]|nr:type II toxin-antitoxin system RelE/ParE family toxin [Pseudomonas putida]